MRHCRVQWGHPEWHIKGDVLPLLDGNCGFHTQDGSYHIVKGKWDMLLAFPPCTHLAVSGARHFEQKREDGRQREGLEFFCKFLAADCDHIAVENPVNIVSGDYAKKWFPDLAEKYNLPIKPTQRIHPWMFGDNFSKATCLWLRGLPELNVLITTQPELEWIEWTDKKTGKKKRQDKWYFDALKNAKTSEERSTIRSKTFPGIAKAMAEQWGGKADDMLTDKEYKALVRSEKNRLEIVYEVHETRDFTEIVGAIGGDSERIRVYRSGLVGCK